MSSREENLPQASEKAWGAVAHYVKSVAKQRGWPNRSHSDLSDIVVDLAQETDDPGRILNLYRSVGALHTNFYENWLSDAMVGGGIEDAAELISRLEKRGLSRPRNFVHRRQGGKGGSRRVERRVKNIHDVCMSVDRRYRYRLEAEVSEDNGRVCMFLMLNPSTADATKSDPTVSTCKRFARDWGYRTLRVCNLFALRSPYPKVLKDSHDPVGDENDEWILRSARGSDVVVCAWGNHGTLLNREIQVRRMLEGAGHAQKMRHLGLTKLGQPRHPLRLRADTLPARLFN